jgi:hypothetical protein
MYAERVGLEPTHGLGPPTAFPGRPLVQLGYLSMGPEVAEGGRVELPGRLVAGRPLSKRVGSPRAQALQVAAPTRFELAVFALTGRRGLHSPTRPRLVRLQGVEP